MKVGPDIAPIASLVGDPARANMLTALLGGLALTATELALESGVTLQTASSHLAKLQGGGLVQAEKQGRHRYYRLTGGDIASVLEGLMGIAARTGCLRTRAGPKEPALRRSRVCYDHLAGDLGVQMFDSLLSRGLVVYTNGGTELTPKGEGFCERLDLDLSVMQRSRRPLCKACLDWSARRHHLAGSLGAALLARFYDLKWARREADSRIVTFSRRGETEFALLFAKAT